MEKVKRYAFISGGLGDFIAIESFLTDEEKNLIAGFYLFTRAAESIKILIHKHPIWKSLSITIPFTAYEIRSFNTYAFFNIDSVYNITKCNSDKFSYLKDCFDLSGDNVYPEILAGNRKYNKSLFDFPGRSYECVIDAESDADDRLVRKGRNLEDKDIKNILKIYPEAFFVGIGRTTLIQAMSAVQNSPVFCGVDSALAAWACRCKNVEKIHVKTVNPIYKKWLPIYDPFGKVKIISDGRQFGI